MRKRYIIFFFICLFLSGCDTITDKAGYIKKDKVTQQLEALNNERTIAVNKAIADAKIAADASRKQLEDNFQKSMDALYGGRLAFNLLDSSSRPWKIADNRFGEAAEYGPPPSKEGLETQNKLLKEELDETKISNDELNKRYNKAIDDAKSAVELQKQKDLLVIQKDKEIQDTKNDFATKIENKQKELSDIKDQLIIKEKENSESKKYIEENKKRISIVCGLLSIVCLIGALFSPIAKDKLGILAAIFAAASVGIIFLQPIHVAIFFGIVFITGGFWALQHFHVLDKTATNLIGFIDNLKTKKPELADEIKTDLQDFNSKYVKTSDGIKKVEDKQVGNYIDSKLVDLQKK